MNFLDVRDRVATLYIGGFQIQMSRKIVVGIIGFIGVFCLMALTYSTSWMERFDTWAGDGVRTLRSEALTPVFRFVADMGEVVPILIVAFFLTCLFWFVFKLRWEIPIIAFALLGDLITNRVLKNFFARVRPTVEHLHFAEGYSFPSGHAMISSTFYALAAYLIWDYCRRKGKKGAAGITVVIGVIWIIALCLSRIYLGVHFPSDIIAGVSLGFVWFLAAVGAISYVRRKDA